MNAYINWRIPNFRRKDDQRHPVRELSGAHTINPEGISLCILKILNKLGLFNTQNWWLLPGQTFHNWYLAPCFRYPADSVPFLTQEYSKQLLFWCLESVAPAFHSPRRKSPLAVLKNTNAVLLTILVDSQGSIQSSLIHSDSSPPSSRQHTLGHLAKWRLHVHPGERVSPYLYSFTDMPLLIQLDWPSYHADNCPRTWKHTEGSEIKRWGDEFRTHGFHQSVLFFVQHMCKNL